MDQMKSDEVGVFSPVLLFRVLGFEGNLVYYFLQGFRGFWSTYITILQFWQKPAMKLLFCFFHRVKWLDFESSL